jgi:hypothetical protein
MKKTRLLSNLNKEIVIDLFDKNREIPSDINTEDWSVHEDKDLGFTVNYPASWEAIPEPSQTANPFAAEEAPAEEEKPEGEDPSTGSGEAGEAAEEEKVEEQPQVIKIVSLQPKNQALFTKAVTIKNDYVNFNSLGGKV